jgi:ABC-type transport system substrate-binding protein
MTVSIRRRLATTLLGATLLVPAAAASAQTLRIAMTAADLPTDTGTPNNGGEGYRFAGFPVYDGLINWDFKHPDQVADITPGLFTSWEIDPANTKRWICKVRQGVKFQDGSDFNVDAVLWNFGRIFDEKSPQYDPEGAPFIRSALSMVQSYEKVDDQTVAITTAYPYSFFPYLLGMFLIASPTQWNNVGHSWAEFAKHPSGTGPFSITKIVPRVSYELTRNENYWDKTRIPKLKHMILQPMPEATTRLAALRSGQVDWIEVPPPDSIPSLRAAGFQISLWPYPHTWPYVYSMAEGSPFRDVRVRQALNFAVDRDGLVKLLNGTAKPAYGLYPRDNPHYGHPTMVYSYDPDRARALLKEAGYGPDHPLKFKVMISTSGSGQMMPIPMNELIQQNLKAVGVDVSFDVVEWGTMLVAFRNPPDAPAAHGVQANNVSLGFSDPSYIFRFYSSQAYSPQGWNWGHWSDPRTDALLSKAQITFDPKARDELLTQAHEIVVDQAPWLFFVHDLNPRAMSKKVVGFQPAQSWFQDFTQVTVQ